MEKIQIREVNNIGRLMLLKDVRHHTARNKEHTYQGTNMAQRVSRKENSLSELWLPLYKRMTRVGDLAQCKSTCLESARP
jgi:hypothetical protein